MDPKKVYKPKKPEEVYPRLDPKKIYRRLDPKEVYGGGKRDTVPETGFVSIDEIVSLGQEDKANIKRILEGLSRAEQQIILVAMKKLDDTILACRKVK